MVYDELPFSYLVLWTTTLHRVAAESHHSLLAGSIATPKDPRAEGCEHAHTRNACQYECYPSADETTVRLGAEQFHA
jgi:hypothetical protein